MRLGQRLIKSNKGFTLAEMILSVAFLAVISVVLLQLFLNAKNLGMRAHDLDRGVQISKSIVETFKACEHPSEFKSREQADKAEVSQACRITTVKLYYDSGWNALEDSGESLPDKAAYLATAEIKPSVSVETATVKSGMYQIDVRIEKVKPYLLDKNRGNEIYRVSAEKYFPDIGQ